MRPMDGTPRIEPHHEHSIFHVLEGGDHIKPISHPCCSGSQFELILAGAKDVHFDLLHRMYQGLSNDY